MTDLQSKHCKACEGEVEALSSEKINSLVASLDAWTTNADKTIISRRFNFKNFYYTMGFVNAIAWISHCENHHPDLEVGYNYCVVKYTTHAILGLSENDFICAAKVDALVCD